MSFRLLDLADELILAIAQTTPISDLLRLRLSCGKLYEICDFPLKERRHRLYLHPRSLYFAIDVCDVPAWSRDITEIVILGNSESTMTTRESHQFPDCRLDYHPWSQFPPTAQGERMLEYSELVAAEFNSFEQNYVTLVDALGKLPRMRTIRYAAKAIEPGFCSVTPGTVMAHAMQRDLWRNSFGNPDQPQMRAALRTVWWSDAEVCSGLLACFPHKFAEIIIEQPMPAVRSVGYRSDFGPTLKPVPSFTGVTSVRYTAPGPEGWIAFVRKMLENMPALQSLEIDIRSARYERSLSSDPTQVHSSHPWEEDIDLSWNPSPIICPKQSPLLQEVMVRGPRGTPFTVVDESLTTALQTYRENGFKLSVTQPKASNPGHGSLQQIATATLSRSIGRTG
ncbi:uncharacterized protein RCC_01609 [Ramularia collo-cygni]|uniref:F-box domain-containing protein n=1 Tax=Ramularia collo-cygni TaxID=112498 RepID=A0A2D3UQW7_9PEZI|nr:uncharacterized protein RCC_01609 [Ramularia collo-cygni]CZT15775.1 uncharacterized protein RCC_01609 [Ramularia collo-cygni]